jgi:regulatory protein YycI of two-component signal transduction system YycFG
MMARQALHKKPAVITDREAVLQEFSDFVAECPIESVQLSLDKFYEAFATLLKDHATLLERLDRYLQFQHQLIEKHGPMHEVELISSYAAIEDIYRKALHERE